MKRLLHLGIVALFSIHASQAIAKTDDPTLHRYERLVRIKIQEQDLPIKVSYRAKSKPGSSSLSAEFLDPRDQRWTQFLLFTDVDFKTITYSADKDPGKTIDLKIKLVSTGADDLIEDEVGALYSSAGNSSAKDLTVETMRQSILEKFPNLFDKNSRSATPPPALPTTEKKKNKTTSPELISGAFDYDHKKFKVEIDNTGMLKVIDEKSGRFLIVTQNVPASYFDTKKFFSPTDRITLQDGILRFDAIERAVDLKHFDAEIDLLGHSQKARVVKDAKEEVIDVVKWMDQEFPDLVEQEREKIRNGTEVDINDIYIETHLDILSTFAAGKSVKFLGDPGVGKTTLIKLLARAIAKGLIPNVPRTLQLRAISTSRLVAGTKYVGSDATRIQSLISFASQVRPAYFIDEFHTMSGAGVYEGNTNNILNTIKGELETGLLRIIAASTEYEWDRAYASDKALNQRFHKVPALAPQGEALLTTLRNAYKLVGKEAPEKAVMEKAIELSNKFAISGAQPRLAINLLLQAGQLRGRAQGSWKASPPDMNAVLEAAVKTYQIDPAYFDSSKAADLLAKLKTLLKEEVVGQQDAVNKTVDLWLKRLSGLSSEEYADSMILMGPPGVGKTFLSKLQSQGLGFHHKLIEMNKYTTGNVEEFRYEVYLALLKSPNTIFTLDEIEKAHPAVQNAALSMLQPGAFTVNFKDSYGKFVFEEVRCRNTMFLMTTNAGQNTVKYKPVGFAGKTSAEDESNPKRSDTELRQALVADGIVEPLISRTPIIVALDLPTRAEFETALKKAVVKTLQSASARKGRIIQLANEKELMTFYMSKFVEGRSDYRTISQYIQSQLDLWIAREIVISESKKESTKTLVIQWAPWVSGQGADPCSQALMKKQ